LHKQDQSINNCLSTQGINFTIIGLVYFLKKILHTKHFFKDKTTYVKRGPSWSESHGSWIYNYLCNQFLSPLMLWVPILIRARCTTLCDNVCQWLATGQWFSPASSTKKTDRHVISEIFSKVTLNTINQPSYN